MMHIGDFDGDGKPDILLDQNSSNDSVVFGKGDGTFTSPLTLSNFPIIGFTRAVVGDFNGDSKSDAAITNYYAMGILLGQSNKTLSLGESDLPAAAYIAPVVGDFNKDGKLDLITEVGNDLQVLLGNGDGTFQVGRLTPTFTTGVSSNPQSFAVGDFDGDGNLDVIAAMSNPAVAEFFYGKGDGTFDGPFVMTLSELFNQVRVADVNGDGRPDLVLYDDHLIAVVHNQGSRTFGPEVHYFAGPIGGLTVQDLNGDGFPEIIVANGGLSNSNASTVTILWNQPGGRAVQGTVGASPEPSVFGQTFTTSLSVAAAPPGSGTPTGNVTFDLDGVFVAAVPLQNGLVSAQVTSSPGAGTHQISASYEGDGTFLPATFVYQHKVIPLVYSTTTNLSVAPNPSVASHTVTLTATVSSPGPLPLSDFGMSGVVGFYDGSATIGVQYLNGRSQAIFDTPLLTGGTHNLSASYLGLAFVYPGNLSFAASTSNVVSETVTASTTSTSLTVLPSSASAGGTLTLSAAVTSPGGIPTGAATFYDGSVALDVQPLDANGMAVFYTSFSAAGAHHITAAYSANASFASSVSAAADIQISGSTGSNATSLLLSAAPQDAEGVALTVKADALHGVPTGSIAFLEGNRSIGQAPISDSGMARYQVATLPPGMHYLTAYYAGNREFAPSAASLLVNTTSSHSPDFSLAVSSDFTYATPGQTVSLGVHVSPVGEFDQDVSLSCFSSAAEVSCGLEPVLVPGGNGSSVLLLTMRGNRSGFMGENLYPRPWNGIWSSLVAGFIFSFGVLAAFGHRKARMAACLMLLVMSISCSVPQVAKQNLSATTQIITVVASSRSNPAVTHGAQIRVVAALE